MGQDMSEKADNQKGFFRRQVLYPDRYAWFILASALDLLLTWVILVQGGLEANVVADLVIRRYGLWGLLAFKFGLVVFVVFVSEIVGQRRPALGRWLATWITLFPAMAAAFGLYLILKAMPMWL